MTRLGVLVPSSNTVLEPVLAAMLADLDGVSLHAARFRVTEISREERANAQFDFPAILAAAELLAHARVDVIVWCGTSASWLGFERDEALCAAIAAATGIPACTSLLALNTLLARQGARRLGLVTPYIAAVRDDIVANYARAGIPVVAERHLGLTDNFSFAETTPAVLTHMIREVAAEAPDAIAIVCTNLAAAPLAAGLEHDLNVPIYDSVATALWRALGIAGVDTRRLARWGRMFET
jgi:maleate isomerase